MEQAYNTRDTLKKIWTFLRPYKLLAAASVVCAALTVVLTLYLPILTGEAVNCIVGPGAVDFAGLVRLLVQMGVVIAFTALFQWLMNLANNRITFCVVRDIRERAFDRLAELPLRYLDGHAHRATLSRTIADAAPPSARPLTGSTQFFTGVLTILGTLVIMLNIHAGIALVVIVLTPMSFLVAAFIAKQTYSMFKLQSETRGELTAHIDEMIGGAKVVQAFGRERAAQERFDEINGRLRDCSLRATFFSSITNPATRFVNSMVYAAVAVVGALAALGGGITVGALTSLLSYANQYTKPFNEISGVVTELQNAVACAARAFELMEAEPQTPDAPDAAVLEHVRGAVTLQNVDFSYRPDQELIRDLNLSVRPGQRVAIVGPTGCGKSTVINLLMRFYDVDGGSISVDGHDIRSVTRASLRASYGMVLQETWLKTGTVRENILFGHPEATEEEMVAAAKAAHAHSFIRRLPQGYDTRISEDGGNLSQGQKQLLCIARVMLSLPPMLILDEATSSIDTRTEIRIQQAFARMMQGRTSFIVAHRLATIREADQILVMRDGKIIEQGNHDELLARGGFYAELYHSQFERF